MVNMKEQNNPDDTMAASELGDLSRRAFFRSMTGYTLGAAIVLGFIPNLTSAQSNKMTQKAAAYQDTPKGTQRCDNCALFVSPDACKMVEGKIAPQGWCSVFTPKV